MVFLYLKLITVYKSFPFLLSMEVLLNVTCVHVCFFFLLYVVYTSVFGLSRFRKTFQFISKICSHITKAWGISA